VPAPPGLTLSSWDLGGAPSAWAYLHAGELFPATEIMTAGPAAPLAEEPTAQVADFPVEPGLSLAQYVDRGPVSGIVVVWHGRVAFERYPRMEPGQRHLLMSVTKVVTAAVAGILELRGQLDLGQPVDSVIGELAGSGWAGVRGRDVLAMASGIDCPEIDSPGAYTDPGHPFYRFEASLGWRPAASKASAYEIVAALPSARPPGQVYEYTSVNTFVLSWLVERVTGRPFAEVLGREIWQRAGFEAPALLCCSAAGAPVSHGGLCVTLRDLARFGMLFTGSAQDVISAAHLRRIQRDRQQWNFAWPDGDLFKGGFGGQGLYVSPARDLVIAFAGTPRADGSVNQLRWYGRQLATSLPGRARR
jgi:CubicO group peptidase (beta-lactamase class C family)